jgi:hypothetical protein
MVGLLELVWRDVSAGAVEPALVPPTHPLGSGEFELFEAPPACPTVDDSVL